MQHAFLYDREIKNEIKGLSQIKPTAGRATKKVTATLILTSLVDVFSILVIYLLITTSNNPTDLNVDGIELPTAEQSSIIEDGGMIKISEKGIFVRETQIHEDEVDSALAALAESIRSEKGEDAKLALIIQADKALDYKIVDPIILKATAMGFSKLKFAVVQEGK